MNLASVIIALATFLSLPASIKGDGVITAEEAIACGSNFAFTKAAGEAFSDGINTGRRRLAGYLASGECIYIAGWHYQVLGEVGQHGFYTAIMASPLPDGPWEAWFTLNDWVR